MKKSICMLAAAVLLAAVASAQTYPARPIRFITVSAPGTVGDIIPTGAAVDKERCGGWAAADNLHFTCDPWPCPTHPFPSSNPKAHASC